MRDRIGDGTLPNYPSPSRAYTGFTWFATGPTPVSWRKSAVGRIQFRFCSVKIAGKAAPAPGCLADRTVQESSEHSGAAPAVPLSSRRRYSADPSREMIATHRLCCTPSLSARSCALACPSIVADGGTIFGRASALSLRRIIGSLFGLFPRPSPQPLWWESACGRGLGIFVFRDGLCALRLRWWLYCHNGIRDDTHDFPLQHLRRRGGRVSEPRASCVAA